MTNDTPLMSARQLTETTLVRVAVISVRTSGEWQDTKREFVTTLGVVTNSSFVIAHSKRVGHQSLATSTCTVSIVSFSVRMQTS